jgi:hypothetical protein
MSATPLFDLIPPSERKRTHRVRDTSKLQVTVKRDDGSLGRRAADIAHWLAWHANATGAAPTTAELALWVAFKGCDQHGSDTSIGRFLGLDGTARTNYIARGIYDAQVANMVESCPDGDRLCTIGKRRRCTWRLRSV